jgi:peptide/nickel transport system substrate-binding protein
MLGSGDVDYMDPNIVYFSTGSLAARMYARQLATFPAIAGQATTAAADIIDKVPSADNGGLSADGLTYTFQIKKGVLWHAAQPRQVTAADFIRGMKRTCNPVAAFGGMPDIQPLIAGFDAYCKAYDATKADGKTPVVDVKSAAALAQFQNTHEITGIKVDASDPLKFTITLTHPAGYFTSMLTLNAFTPAPVEYDKYIPGSAELAQHLISDGPYDVTSYSPNKSIVFKRNPTWDATTDPIRKAYVDEIDVNETGQPQAIQQQLEANTVGADMSWDAFPPVGEIPRLLRSKDPNFYLGASYGTNPYIVYNLVSPSNSGALSKVQVRQAISEAINRDNLIQVDNGPQVSPPLTHVLPAGISGTKSNTSFDPYPYNVDKAKQDLAAAGFPNGLTLKVLYRSASTLAPKVFTTLQQDLQKAGITLQAVTASNQDFLTKYLMVPGQAKSGVWDMAIAGWGPDWYGDSALSFFGPLFNGKDAYPPNGSNFGFYENPAVDTAIAAASKETDPAKSAADWEALDKMVMADAPFYPVTSNLQPIYHSSHVHNTVYIPTDQQNDPTNVWLSTP